MSAQKSSPSPSHHLLAPPLLPLFWVIFPCAPLAEKRGVGRRQPWEIFRHLKSLRLCQGQNYQSLIRSLTWTSPVERLSRPREFRKGGCGHSDSHRGAKSPLYYSVRPFASSAWHRSRALIVGPGESSIWSLVGLFLSISPVSLALLPARLSDLE